MAEIGRGAAAQRPLRLTRLGRPGWLGYSILLWLVATGVSLALLVAGFRSYVAVGQQLLPVLDYRLALPLLLIHSAASVPFNIRRRRDRGRSGIDTVVAQVLLFGATAAFDILWHPTILTISTQYVIWSVVTFLPVLYLLITLLILPGNVGPNRYGPSPRRHENDGKIAINSHTANGAVSDITQPHDRRAPTTGELATLPRITRSRFIGNAIGALVVLAIIVGIYVAIGMNAGANPALYTTLTPKPGATLVLPSPTATSIFALLYLCIFIDLAVRRRHDRNRSGVDVIVWAEIAVGALVLHLFAPRTIEGLAFDGLTALLGLWLLLVLVFLPGTKGANRYGEDPVALLRRAGH